MPDIVPGHPVACGVPLPPSLLGPHREFCNELRSTISKIGTLVETLEAWADDIERTVADTISETTQALSHRSTPY